VRNAEVKSSATAPQSFTNPLLEPTFFFHQGRHERIREGRITPYATISAELRELSPPEGFAAREGFTGPVRWQSALLAVAPQAKASVWCEASACLGQVLSVPSSLA
jgi:hypothetical protein